MYLIICITIYTFSTETRNFKFHIRNIFKTWLTNSLNQTKDISYPKAEVKIYKGINCMWCFVIQWTMFTLSVITLYFYNVKFNKFISDANDIFLWCKQGLCNHTLKWTQLNFCKYFKILIPVVQYIFQKLSKKESWIMELIIAVGVKSNPIKHEGLYDRFDHAPTVMINLIILIKWSLIP